MNLRLALAPGVIALQARQLGRAARATLGAGGPTTVFAAFERGFYVETRAGIACIGGPHTGRGPLNVIVQDLQSIPSPGSEVTIDLGAAVDWRPPAVRLLKKPFKWMVPERISVPWRDHRQARAFLRWLGKGALKPAPHAANALIGLGPGLTPSGDDFICGAMIALRACGRALLADRVADWALARAVNGTGRISRAHLGCAAAGEGHEALHELLAALDRGEAASGLALDALSRVGHSSGLDAAAGALLAIVE